VSKNSENENPCQIFFERRKIMSTELQIEANRKNAQKSTGPRTSEGKDVSSQNALKHGLCANRNVIRTESQEEYNIFRDEMIADISPAGAMELMLAERIVSLSWRLKRAEHFQNAAMNALIERDLNDSGYGWNDTVRHQARDEAADGDFDLILGITVNTDFSRNKILEQLLAYEHRIENSLYRAIAELKKMQEIRREQEKRNEKKREKEEIDIKVEANQMMDETREMMEEGRETRNEQVLKNVILRSSSYEGQEANPFDYAQDELKQESRSQKTEYVERSQY
jgi:hypothetical protein